MNKVLFVSSGTSGIINPIIERQMKSLQTLDFCIESFLINEKGFWGYLKNIRKLKAYLKNNKFDIIHAHYGLCGIVAAHSKTKEKLIVSFMGDDILGSNNFSGNLSTISRVLVSINIFYSKRYYDHIIVKSKEMFAKIKYLKYVDLIPNGIDLNVFKPREIKHKREYIKISFFSNPNRSEKNFKLVKDALDLVDFSFKLSVNYLLDVDELVSEINDSDIIVLSSFHEGSPNIIKEAMACNKIIVSTDVGDVSWLFGKTEGCFLSSFSPLDFSNKLNNAYMFLLDKGESKGRIRIIELNLGSNIIANKILSIYDKLIRKCAE